MAMLERVMLKGFKSIRQMDLELRWLNVMIVANGAGKSNLISFFQLLNEMIGGRLQIFVATAGRAHSLFFGSSGGSARRSHTDASLCVIMS